jgi:diguanylate cyclase (GGDEF)-like protein
VLKACCRSTDTCARFGGDEFAVILPHSNRTAAVVVRDRILQQIAKTVVPLEHQELTISLSIGIATLLDDALDTAGLVSAADSAMYEAKAAYHAGHVDESAA